MGVDAENCFCLQNEFDVASDIVIKKERKKQGDKNENKIKIFYAERER